MDKFEEKLMKLNIEKPEPSPFKQELRRDLINSFVHEKSFQTPFRLAFGFSCVVLFFAFLIVADPRLAVKLNQLTLNNYKGQQEKIDISNPASLQNLEYTTINNPKLMAKIDAKGYKEEKAYIIRQYRGDNKEPVMVVSEFKNDSSSMIKEASTGGI